MKNFETQNHLLAIIIRKVGQRDGFGNSVVSSYSTEHKDFIKYKVANDTSNDTIWYGLCTNKETNSEECGAITSNDDEMFKILVKSVMSQMVNYKQHLMEDLHYTDTIIREIVCNFYEEPYK